MNKLRNKKADSCVPVVLSIERSNMGLVVTVAFMEIKKIKK